MTIYLLIHEQDTDAAWGSDVKPFTDKQAARVAMRSEWQTTARDWEYDSKEHHDEDECVCCDDTAVIRDGDDVEHWRIEEHELDVQVAVRVKGGLVEEVYANAGVSVDVFDLDVSDFPDEGEQEDADDKEAELETLIASPGWSVVW